MAIKRVRYAKKKKRRIKSTGSKFVRGFYEPIREAGPDSPHKKYKQPLNTYMNSSQYPEYRSSWELFYMRVLDSSDQVQYWSTEAFPIMYWDSQQQKKRRYFPDFMITLKDGTKLIHEIKPANQTNLQNNKDKWEAAYKFCKQHNITFHVITEKELKQFGMKS